MDLNIFYFKEKLKNMTITDLRQLKNDYVIKRCKGDKTLKTLYKIQAITNMLLKGEIKER